MPRNPEIIVTGGFPEFFVTAIDQLLSRSFFLYFEVMKTALLKFYWKVAVSFAKAVYDFAVYVFNYVGSSFKTYVFLQELGFFLKSCLLSTPGMGTLNPLFWVSFSGVVNLNKDFENFYPST